MQDSPERRQALPVEATVQVCQFCGRPVLGWTVYGGGGEPYHPECTQPPAPIPSFPGYVPSPNLTEADVRRIVKEELARHSANAK